MIIANPQQRRHLSVTLLLCTGFILLAIPRAVAQTQSPEANNSSGQSPSQDAAAKAAAERKKRFEEEEKRLEDSEGQPTRTQSESAQASDDDLSISPVLVNMLVHETQGFSLFDNAGHNLTSKAEWTLSNSYVADLTTSGTPTITSKDAGTVVVRARVGMRSAEASVTVHSGDKLPIGTIRWQAPKARATSKAQQIVIAAP